MVGGVVERAALRTADWRFLLAWPRRGQFDHLVLLGAPAGVAARVADLALARRVSEEIPREQCADAIVVLHGARATPNDFRDRLLPGAAVYWEVNRRSLNRLGATPGRVRRLLRTAGLRPIGLYAVGPNVFRPRVYLPLDVPLALRWYVETLYNPWTRSLGLAERALRVLTGLDTRRYGVIAPDLAVSAVVGDAPDAESLVDIAVRESGVGADGSRPLILTSTHPETLAQRLVIMPFAPNGDQPMAVVKISKAAALNATAESEQAALAALRERLDPAMRPTIPEPLGVKRLGDLTVTAESYGAGQSLQRSSCRWDRPVAAKLEDLDLAANWLAEFHRQTTTARPPWSAAETTEWVMQPIDQYRATFGETEPERRLFSAASAYAATLTGTPLPIVMRKPDFFGSNVVRAGHRVSVVDWESSYAGPALCDLLRFVVPWADVVSRIRGPRTFENFERIFFGPPDSDDVVRGVHAAIQRYTERLQMHPALTPVLLLYTWIERGLHHVHKQRLQAVVPRDARTGNKHVGRIAVLAAHVEQLFDARHVSGDGWPAAATVRRDA
jgi:hypothetical protein